MCNIYATAQKLHIFIDKDGKEKAQELVKNS